MNCQSIRHHLSLQNGAFFYLIIVTLFYLAGCSGSKKTTSADNSYFIIGSGGGVTGMYEEYRISKNGDIQQYDFEKKKFEAHGSFTDEQTTHIWSELDQLNLENKSIDDPGNYTYYIRGENQKVEFDVKWNDSSIMPGRLREFYKTTQRTIAQVKY